MMILSDTVIQMKDLSSPKNLDHVVGIIPYVRREAGGGCVFIMRAGSESTAVLSREERDARVVCKGVVSVYAIRTFARRGILLLL